LTTSLVSRHAGVEAHHQFDVGNRRRLSARHDDRADPRRGTPGRVSSPAVLPTTSTIC
jgi:hypothetical protein